MKKLKALFLLLSFFILLTLSAYAGLGETEKQILVQRPAALDVKSDIIDDKAKVMMVQDKDTTYGAGFIDGVCEIEVFTNNNDSKFTSSFVVSMLKMYAKDWIPVDCNEEACHIAMSSDGRYFANFGPSKSLRRKNVLSIFTKKWADYAKEVKSKQANI